MTLRTFPVKRALQASLCLLLPVLGCNQPTSNNYVEPPPPDVTVTSPTQRAVTEYLEFTGTTQPVESVEIRARVKGFLKERLFTEGAEVKKGDLLLVIDEEPFQIQLESAQSMLAVAKANLRKAKESKAREVGRAQVALSESQLQLAIQDERRISNLHARNVAPQSDLDEAIATRKTREAEVLSAKANLEQALATYDTDIIALEAQAASQEIAIRDAQLSLSYCRMFAPIDGRITQTEYDPGNLVGDGESSVLATIVKIAPIYAYVNVSENDLLKTREIMRPKTPGGDAKEVEVELGLANQSEFPFRGKVDYADPGLDPGTGTLRTRAIFENTGREILPGMFVRLRVPVAEKPDALLVPERALGTDQSGQYLLVVNEKNEVEYCPVQVGVAIDGMRVVEGKLRATDRIILEGLLRARPGAPVTPKTLEVKPDGEVATTSAAGRL